MSPDSIQSFSEECFLNCLHYVRYLLSAASESKNERIFGVPRLKVGIPFTRSYVYAGYGISANVVHLQTKFQIPLGTFPLANKAISLFYHWILIKFTRRR